MTTPDAFFTPSTFVTLGGASIAALMLKNVLRGVFGASAINGCFAVCVVICGIGGWEAHPLSSLMGGVTALANSALLFCTTTGMHDFAVSLGAGKPAGEKHVQGAAPRD